VLGPLKGTLGVVRRGLRVGRHQPQRRLRQGSPRLDARLIACIAVRPAADRSAPCRLASKARAAHSASTGSGSSLPGSAPKPAAARASTNVPQHGDTLVDHVAGACFDFAFQGCSVAVDRVNPLLKVPFQEQQSAFGLPAVFSGLPEDGDNHLMIGQSRLGGGRAR